MLARLSRTTAVAILSLLLSAATASAQNTPNDAAPEHQATMDDLRDLVRTLRQEREAHYQRSGERTRKLDDTRAAVGRLEAELADLRAREDEVDRTLAEVRSDVDRFEQDLEHSDDEKRYYCLGKVADGIMTVRFTYRKNKIRTIGAGYWRKGKKIYEEEN